MSRLASAPPCSSYWPVSCAIPSGIANTSICLQYAVLALFAILYGPVAGGLIGFIGHTLGDLSWGGSPWWSWVLASAMVGVIIGLVSKKIDLSSGRFGKKELITFVLTTLVAMAISWIVVAPVLDIVIYAEPAKKVFAQGLVAGASNFVTTAVIGSLLMLAYTKTIAKSGSLKQE